MQHIAPATLRNLPDRIAYLTAFLNFTAADASYLHAAAPIVKPLIPVVVDTVYVKLLSFDITAKAFIPRQTGFEDTSLDEKTRKVEDLNQEDKQIKFRKGFLIRYLAKLVEMKYDNEKDWEYLDKVAIMHTGQLGFQSRAKKPALRVELIHMSALLGYVMDILLEAVINHPTLDSETKAGVLRAFNKVIWIQNDLFSRHYVVDEDSGVVPIGFKTLSACRMLDTRTLLLGLGVVGCIGLELIRRMTWRG